MKKISLNKARSRRAMLRSFLRWFLYSAALLLFYLFETNPIIRGFCPLLIIPLATAVAMYEGDLAAGVFGTFCGLMLDMANGIAVTGFSALWLLCLCPAISLLSRFWIKVNLVSHLVMNAITAVVMAFMDMVFLHWVWEGAASAISFKVSVFPAYGGAVLFSAPVYLLVRLINKVLRPGEQERLEGSARRLEENAQAAKEAERRIGADNSSAD